jgi:hypothetical protein
MTSIGPKAQGKSINRAALTESLLRYLLGLASLTPTYSLPQGVFRMGRPLPWSSVEPALA